MYRVTIERISAPTDNTGSIKKIVVEDDDMGEAIAEAMLCIGRARKEQLVATIIAAIRDRGEWEDVTDDKGWWDGRSESLEMLCNAGDKILQGWEEYDRDFQATLKKMKGSTT